MSKSGWFFLIIAAGILMWIAMAINQISLAGGSCFADCASEQGICIAQCRGDVNCIAYCQQAHGRCIARCSQ